MRTGNGRAQAEDLQAAQDGTSAADCCKQSEAEGHPMLPGRVLGMRDEGSGEGDVTVDEYDNEAETIAAARSLPAASAKAKKRMRRKAAMVIQQAARGMKERRRDRRDRMKRSRKRERYWAAARIQAVVRGILARNGSLHVWRQMQCFGGRHDEEGQRLAVDSYVLWCDGIGGEMEITGSGKRVWKVEEMWDEMFEEEQDGCDVAVVAAIVIQERWREHGVQRRHDADTMVVMETLKEWDVASQWHAHHG